MSGRIYRGCTLFIALLLAAKTTNAQQTFFNIGTIQKIELHFSQADWDYELDTNKLGAGKYMMAQWVKINGIQYDSVGVKYKGSSSYDSSFGKNPLHIRMDKYVDNQSYQGVTNIKLANDFRDPSMIREALCYNMLSNYMDCPRANFVQLYVNDTYIGVYTNDEDIDNAFVQKHFYSSDNTFVKCNPDLPTQIIKSNLRYLSADSSQYFNIYDLQSDNGWNELVALCDTVTNNGPGLGADMDMDRTMWMLSFDNLMVNLDSYEGEFAQNYFLYKDHTNHFNPIVWDLNLSLGGFPYAGNGITSSGTLSNTEMEQLSPGLHANDMYWPLIKDVMSNATYKRMYIAHMRTMMNEMLASGLYQTTAAQMQATLDTAVQSDNNKFYTYAQFTGGMTGDVNVGNYTVPGISNLVTARVAYLQSIADFTAMPPAISNIASVPATPVINNMVSFTAMVANANGSGVYFGYRFDTMQHFTRVQMFDDGNHNDGAANDNVYGTGINMDAANIEYYIYAENDNAGMFAPERAEHEFYHATGTTGISYVNGASSAVSIYPNPSSSYIHIVAGNQVSSVLITDMAGKVVSSIAATGKETDINVSSLAGGMYLVKVNNETPEKITIIR